MENKELDKLFKETMDDDYFKSKIKDALTEKLISTIKYDADAFIQKKVSEIYDEEFQLEISKEMDKQKEKLKDVLSDGIKDAFKNITNNIKIKISAWRLQKLITDNISIEDSEGI